MEEVEKFKEVTRNSLKSEEAINLAREEIADCQVIVEQATT
jgi:hypothetical protein